MIIDFTLNENCECILRMDDTNPETEKQEYVDAIKDDVEWLEFNYTQLTYTSNYFNQLYNFAVELIIKNKAYVDLTPPDKMKNDRHNGIESEFRSKPNDWNLLKFDKMKTGKYKENEAVLRLKIDMKNDNHSLRDPIAYRIKFTPHYRTDKFWYIYPLHVPNETPLIISN